MKMVLKSMTVFVAVLLIVYGCKKDNPVENHHSSDHAEAAGLVVMQNGAEIVRYENGIMTGKITVTAGVESSVLSVMFIDEHDGELFTPDKEHHSLVWTIADATVAEAYQKAGDEKWSLHILGIKTGNTTIEIKVMHEDHADFVSLPIPLQVS